MKFALLRRRYSATGGAENYLERLAGALQKKGHEVTLWCEAWNNPHTAIQTIQSVPTGSPEEFAQAIAAKNLKRDYDVVFSLERVPGCDIYRAGDGMHAQWLETRARYSPLLGRVRNWIRPKNRALCRLESAVFDPKRTRLVIANSQMVQRQVVARFGFPPERVPVVYNGVPFERFSNGSRENGRRALGLGRDDFAVLLVGAGRERKGVAFARAAARRCGVPNAKLVLIDRPPRVPMSDVYAAAEVFLLPTLYDPFANVTLEALAAGLPVLTTRHNGAAEIFTPESGARTLERADDVSAIADWLRAMADPGARAAIKPQAQALARQFSLERNVEETLAVCQD